MNLTQYFQTGTLTEGDLDLAGVCEAKEGQFQVIHVHKYTFSWALVNGMGCLYKVFEVLWIFLVS